ncbi:glycosyltransferase family 4 protein [Rubripirellula amarantea]|nr:glycosyltransferase family 4 protein [Rubripirellula amarantea]
MKVSYLSGSKLPSRTADTVHVIRMCNAISNLGHEVQLCIQATDDQPEEALSNYSGNHLFQLASVRNTRLETGRQFYYAHAASKLIEKFQPDVVICRHLLGGCFIARKFPTIYEIHAMYGTVGSMLQRNMLGAKYLRGVISISSSLKNDFVEKHRNSKIDRDRIQVEPDAADPVAADTVPVDLGPGNLHVGYCGQLYRGRGIETIVELSKSLPNVTFHVVGGEPADVVSFKRSVGNLSNLKFHGHVPHHRVPSYLKAFDVVLAPYERHVETASGMNTIRWCSPMKLFETLAAGRPLVISDLPVFHEILKHNHNALFVSSDSLEQWIEAITRLEDSTLRRELGRVAQATHEKRFTWSARAERILRFHTALT